MFNQRAFQVLEKALEAASLRQQAISHNLANVNTPGFKKAYVTFEEDLKRALGMQKKIELEQTHPRHLPMPVSLRQVEPQVQRDHSTSLRNDGNNVDIDEEMAKLAMNTINYNAAVQLLNARLGMLRYAINEGRK
ncbi:flagellar basal body rod protein FlgB [Calderihabitans maritimus]|uniref:Flagellar basal body rod protein FlgB n=1 Tax=Calderihabitans maritimus TaxID=1246530 RepID=A0A1Z5HTP9_9FIRM|nr:flagellar basal body rod protein FlgB [Calderihabitans maritimus]GAW92913.1 flagellar basal body protein [Calderihabitans maritimus]